MSAADVPIESEPPAEGQTSAGPLAGTTAWARNLEAPLRDFLRTESGSAVVLLVAAIVALVWANVGGSYERVWNTALSIRVGGGGVTQDLRYWVNSGLMALFFFVAGLEARREFDLGELRDRKRLMLPLVAGLFGMAVPVALFVLLDAGDVSSGGWGTAMSTDTAFALGLLALVGRRFPGSLQAFMLTVAVVDDIVAILVIAIFFTDTLHPVGLFVGIGAFALVFGLRARGVRNGLPYLVLALIAWVGVEKSGIDPISVGLLAGLLTIAYPASREDLERASDLFRVFREQPTSELEQEARTGLRTAISPNERFQQMFHPFTSYLVVPLFALANAGFPISGSFLAHAYGSALTLGILIGYVVGKPLGIFVGAGAVVKLSRGRIVPPVGWVSVLGGGAIAGIGFTVSLLIATLAFSGQQLAEAKLGVLTTIVAAPVVTMLVQAGSRRLPRRWRAQALLGSADVIVDLAVPVDPERDHIRGPEECEVTLVEYGDLECPFCGRAETVVRELLADFGDLRYVWRHLPLNDVHPHAQLAAEASEAAADQGRFWDMHDLMLAHQDALNVRDIMEYAKQLELDIVEFKEFVRKRRGTGHIADDVESADLSGVSGTPSFFINGHRHQGAYDLDTLSRAVRSARVRQKIRS